MVALSFIDFLNCAAFILFLPWYFGWEVGRLFCYLYSSLLKPNLKRADVIYRLLRALFAKNANSQSDVVYNILSFAMTGRWSDTPGGGVIT